MAEFYEDVFSEMNHALDDITAYRTLISSLDELRFAHSVSPVLLNECILKSIVDIAFERVTKNPQFTLDNELAELVLFFEPLVRQLVRNQTNNFDILVQKIGLQLSTMDDDQRRNVAMTLVNCNLLKFHEMARFLAVVSPIN